MNGHFGAEKRYGKFDLFIEGIFWIISSDKYSIMMQNETHKVVNFANKYHRVVTSWLD